MIKTGLEMPGHEEKLWDPEFMEKRRHNLAGKDVF